MVSFGLYFGLLLVLNPFQGVLSEKRRYYLTHKDLKALTTSFGGMTAAFTISAMLIAVGSGFLGALLGLGGGVILVPLLVFMLNIPIQYAAGASIIAVVATSSAATSVYVKNELTNLKLGMFLELATTLGALSGAVLMSMASESILQTLFGATLLYASMVMGMRMRNSSSGWINKPNDWVANKLELGGSYWDDSSNEQITYGVNKTLPTFIISYLAGIISGLLGIGGGGIKVPAMNVISNVPMKVSVATSNFMIGVTASASALLYLRYGYCDFFITGPVVLGTLIGSYFGAKATNHIRGTALKKLFIIILVVLGLRMIISGIGSI